MIAYNQTGLDNMHIREQADEAFAAGCITPEENTKIRAAHPFDFYTPNIFICIGLFALTLVITICALGMFMLFTARDSNSTMSPILIFYGLACYGALELTVYKLRHFRSGVDYALLWMSAALFFTGIYMAIHNMSAIGQCILVFIISLLFTIRYGNIIMALLVYSALLALIINITAESGTIFKLFMPFLIMAVSVGAWFLANRFHSHKACRHYRQCLTALKAATLVSFYLAGNYYVVRELGTYLLGSSAHSESSISLGWLFWILTAATPLLYIYLGIRKKDPIFLWTGLALIAVTVFTIRYYYHLLPAEWAMMFGGIMILLIAYGLIRYLRTPRHGFTSLENNKRHLLESLNIESLVIAETFAAPAPAPNPDNGFQFGGGSGGGGGAGGQF